MTEVASDARTEILERVRRALADARPPAAVPRDYARSRPVDDLIEHFAERVADYRAVVERVAPTELAAAVAAACDRYAVGSLVVPPDLPDGWLAALAGVQVRRDAGPSGPGAPPEGQLLRPADLDGVDAVVTGAAVGIAETGTIVLDAGRGQGRRALSLVPDVHVCVVAASQVVDDVPAAVARLDPLRPLTWISGPSATSDIELDRVEGVHGPRTLHVLIVEDEGHLGGPRRHR